MGERHSGQTFSGRRHADGRTGVFDEAALEQHLAAAVRRSAPSDPAEAEQRALAAFRAARDSGAHRARTRRRDDWRPRRRRLGGHSVKALLGVVLGGLTLSGVAVAGIGAPGSGQDAPAGRDRATIPSSPRSSAPPTGRPAPGAAAGGTSDTSRPAPARDTEAHCRAHERIRDRGEVLKSPAWQRLLTATHGTDNADAPCAGLTGKRAAGPSGDAKSSESAGSSEGAGGADIPDAAGPAEEVSTPQIPEKRPTRPAGDATGTGNLPAPGRGGGSEEESDDRGGPVRQAGGTP